MIVTSALMSLVEEDYVYDGDAMVLLGCALFI
jgi:hypothetical protein